MPSSYDPLNRVEEQNPGENLSTWGAKLNSQTIALLSFAISGYTALAISGPVTLTANNGAADQARSAILDFTSGTGGAVTIPAVSHVYVVRNNTSGNLVFTTGSGNSATVEPGSLATVFSDGTNCYRLVDAADIAACLAAAETYANGLAFESSSGQLPGQAGNAGKFLTTDGSTANWAPPLPNQTGLPGATLTTDGTNASWNTGLSSSISAVSSSLSSTNSNVAKVSSSLAGVSTSLAGVSTSLGSAVSGTNAGSIGTLGIPLVTKSGDYTLQLSDAGKHLFFTANATLTIPSNASVPFDLGTFFKASADNGVTLHVAITSDTLRYPTGGTSGTRTVTGRGFVVVEKEKSTEWWVTGAGGTVA